MNMAGFTAEISLYKTGRSYGGYSGTLGFDTASTVIAQQFDCDTNCVISLCRRGCGVNPVCLIECLLDAQSCFSGCSSGSGGGGGCASGVCCERDDRGRCVICKPVNGECP
jgi:hypothetical protein